MKSARLSKVLLTNEERTATFQSPFFVLTKSGFFPADALDARAQGLKFLFDALVAAVNVIYAVDPRGIRRDQPGQHQRSAGAQIRRDDGRAAQRRGAVHDRASSVDCEMFAPMRVISLACMKRFSKIVSVMLGRPSA